MCSILDQLSEINNRACDCFEKGDLANAMVYFREALTYFRSYLRDLPKETWKAGVSRNILPMSMDQLRLQGMSEYPSTTANSNFMVHSDTIRMIPGNQFSGEEVENIKIHTSVVVFNLALTTHMQGLMQRSHRHLSQAQALYMHTYKLVYGTVVDAYKGQATGNAAFDMLVLALFNNLALIHNEFSNYSESSVVFKQLLRYVMSVSQNLAEPGEVGFPTDNKNEHIYHQINSFLLNATVLGLNPPTAAGAA